MTGYLPVLADSVAGVAHQPPIPFDLSRPHPYEARNRPFQPDRPLIMVARCWLRRRGRLCCQIRSILIW